MLTGRKDKLTHSEREEKRRELDALRSSNESQIMGGYELIFPLVDNGENE